MKLKLSFIAVMILLYLVGCTVEKTIVETQPADTKKTDSPTEKKETAPVETVADAPKKVDVPKTCEQKAAELFPAELKLTLNSEKDPNADKWELDEGMLWADNTAVDTKGTITFQKGRLSGENTNNWYTRNDQNEKLFGQGGLKYEVSATTKAGVTGKNKFIIKPVLKPVSVVDPKEPYSPHIGIFTIADPQFQECEFLE